MFHSMMELQSGMMEELYRAAQSGDTENMKTLFRRGATVNSASAQRRFVQLAATSGDQELLKMLLQRGMALRDPSSSLEALHYAAEDGDAELVELLLEHGARPYVNDVIRGVKDTALHLTVRGGHLQATQVLLNHCADISSLSSTRRCTYGQQDTFDFFVDENVTPLHIAAEEGHFEVTKALLAKSPDINACTEYGYSPLHLAVNENHDDIVRLLLEQGAKISALTKEGESVVDIATRRRHHKILKTLEEHMMIVMIATEMRYEEEERHFASSRVKRVPKRKQSKPKIKTSKQMRQSGEENGHSGTTTVIHERQTSNGITRGVHDSKVEVHGHEERMSQDHAMRQGLDTGRPLKAKSIKKEKQSKDSGNRNSIVQETVVGELGSAPRASSETETALSPTMSTPSDGSGREGQHVTGGLILLKVEKTDERTLWRSSMAIQEDGKKRPPETTVSGGDKPDGIIFSSFHTMGTGPVEEPVPSSPNSSFTSLEDRPIIDCSVKKQSTKSKSRSVGQDKKDSRKSKGSSSIPSVGKIYFRTVKGVSLESNDSTEQSEEEERYHDAREYHNPQSPVNTYVTAYKTYSSYIYPIPPTIPYADEHVDEQQSPNVRYRDKTDDEIFFELCEAHDSSPARPTDGAHAEARWTSEGDIEMAMPHQQNVEPISDLNGNYQDTTQASSQVSLAPKATVSEDETSDDENSQFQDALQEITPLIISERNLETSKETLDPLLDDSDEEYLNDRTMKAAISLMQSKYSYGSEELTSDTASEYEEAELNNTVEMKKTIDVADPANTEKDVIQFDEGNSTIYQETVTIIRKPNADAIQEGIPLDEIRYIDEEIQYTTAVHSNDESPQESDEDIMNEEWTANESNKEGVQEELSEGGQSISEEVSCGDDTQNSQASDEEIVREEWTTYEPYVQEVQDKTQLDEIQYTDDDDTTNIANNSEINVQTLQASDEGSGSEEEWTILEEYTVTETVFVTENTAGLTHINSSERAANVEEYEVAETSTTHISNMQFPKQQIEPFSGPYDNYQATHIKSKMPSADRHDVNTLATPNLQSLRSHEPSPLKEHTNDVSGQDYNSNEYSFTTTDTNRIIDEQTDVSVPRKEASTISHTSIHDDSLQFIDEDGYDTTLRQTSPEVLKEQKELHKERTDSDQAGDVPVLSHYYQRKIPKEKDSAEVRELKTANVTEEHLQPISNAHNNSEQYPSQTDVRGIITNREETMHGTVENDAMMGQPVLEPNVTPLNIKTVSTGETHLGVVDNSAKESPEEDVNETHGRIIKPEYKDVTSQERNKPVEELDDDSQEKLLYNSGKTIEAAMSYMSRKYDYDSGKDSSDDGHDAEKSKKPELSTFEIPVEGTHISEHGTQHTIQTKNTDPTEELKTKTDHHKYIKHTSSASPMKITMVQGQSSAEPITTPQIAREVPKGQQSPVKTKLNEEDQGAVILDPNTITPIKPKKKKKKKPSRPSRRLLVEQDQQSSTNNGAPAEPLKDANAAKSTPDAIHVSISDMPGESPTTNPLRQKTEAGSTMEKDKDVMKKRPAIEIISVSHLSTNISEKIKPGKDLSHSSNIPDPQAEDSKTQDEDTTMKKTAIELISVNRPSTDTVLNKDYPMSETQSEHEGSDGLAEEEYIMDAVANTEQSEIVAKIDQIIIENLSNVKGKYNSENTSPEATSKQETPTKEREALIRQRFSGRPTEIDSLMQYVDINRPTIQQQQQSESHIRQEPQARSLGIEAVPQNGSGEVHSVVQQVSTLITDLNVKTDTPEKKVRKKKKEKKEKREKKDKKEKKIKPKQSEESIPVVITEADEIISSEPSKTSSTMETTVVMRKREKPVSQTNNQEHKSEADRQSLIRVTNLDDYMNLYNPSPHSDTQGTKSTGSAGKTPVRNTSCIGPRGSPQNTFNESLSGLAGNNPKVGSQGSVHSTSNLSLQTADMGSPGVRSQGLIESTLRVSYPEPSKSKSSVGKPSPAIPNVSVAGVPVAGSQGSVQITSIIRTQPSDGNTSNISMPSPVAYHATATRNYGSPAKTPSARSPKLSEATPNVTSQCSAVGIPESHHETSINEGPSSSLDYIQESSSQGSIKSTPIVSLPRSGEIPSNVSSPGIGEIHKASPYSSHGPAGLSVEDTHNVVQHISSGNVPKSWGSWGSAAKTSTVGSRSPRSIEDTQKLVGTASDHKTSIVTPQRPTQDTSSVSPLRLLEMTPVACSQKSIDITSRESSHESVQKNPNPWRSTVNTSNMDTSIIDSSRLVEPVRYWGKKHTPGDRLMHEGQHQTSDILNSSGKEEISPQRGYHTEDLGVNKLDHVQIPPRLARGNETPIKTSKGDSTTVDERFTSDQHENDKQDDEHKVARKKAKSKDKSKDKKKKKKIKKTMATDSPEASEPTRGNIADVDAPEVQVKNTPDKNPDLPSVNVLDESSVSSNRIVASTIPGYEQQTAITTTETVFRKSSTPISYAEESIPHKQSVTILPNTVENTPTKMSQRTASHIPKENTQILNDIGGSVESTSSVSPQRSVENTSSITSVDSVENTSKGPVTNTSDVGSQGSISNMSNVSSPGSKKTFVLTIIGHKSATGTHHTPEVSFEDSHKPHRQGAFHEKRQPKHDHAEELSIDAMEVKPNKSAKSDKSSFKATNDQHTTTISTDTEKHYEITRGPDGFEMTPVAQYPSKVRYSGNVNTSYDQPMEQDQYQTETMKIPDITTPVSLKSSHQKERSRQREESQDKNYNIQEEMDLEVSPTRISRGNLDMTPTLKEKEDSRVEIDSAKGLQDGEGKTTKKKSKSKDKKSKLKKSKKKSAKDSPGESMGADVANEEILAGQGEDVPSKSHDLARVNISGEKSVSPKGIAATSTPEQDQQYALQQTTITTQETTYNSSRIGLGFPEETTPHRPSVQILPIKRRKLSEKEPEDANKENQGLVKKEGGLLRNTTSQSGVTVTPGRPPPHSGDRRSFRQTDYSFTSPREAAKKSRPMSVPDVYVLVKFDKGSLSNLGVVNKDNSTVSESAGDLPAKTRQNVSFQTDPYFLDTSEISHSGFDDSDLRTKSMDELDIDRPPTRSRQNDQGLTRSQSGGALDDSHDVGWGSTQHQSRAGYKKIVMPGSYLSGSPVARSNQVYREEDQSSNRSGQSGVQFKPHDQLSVYHSQTHVGSPNYVQVTARPKSRPTTQRPPRPRNRSLSTEPSPGDSPIRAPRPRPRSAHEPRQLHHPRQAISVDGIPQEIHMPIPNTQVPNRSHSKSLTWGDSREKIDHRPVEMAIKASPVTSRHQERPTSMPEQRTPYIQVQPSGVKHSPSLGRVPPSQLKGSSQSSSPQQGYNSPIYQQSPHYAAATHISPQQQYMTISPTTSTTTRSPIPKQRMHTSTTRISPGTPQYPRVLPSDYIKRTSDPTGLRGRLLQSSPPQDDETDIW